MEAWNEKDLAGKTAVTTFKRPYFCYETDIIHAYMYYIILHIVRILRIVHFCIFLTNYSEMFVPHPVQLILYYTSSPWQIPIPTHANAASAILHSATAATTIQYTSYFHRVPRDPVKNNRARSGFQDTRVVSRFYIA